MDATVETLESRGIKRATVDAMPSLEEKWLVDFVNGLDVARDHDRVSRARSSNTARLFDGVSGKGKRRQDEINSSVIDALEGSLKWLKEVTRETSNNGFAIARVNDRLNELRIDVGRLAEFSRARAAKLNEVIGDISRRLEDQQSRLGQLDLRVRAQENLRFVMDRWAAGGYDGLSPLGRCYLALEELRWDAFGDFMIFAKAADKSAWRDNLIDKLSFQMARDIGMATKQRLVFDESWARQPRDGDDELDSVVQFLGDWSDSSQEPFVFVASQQANILPVAVPRIANAERVACGLIKDVFGVRTYVG